MRILDWLWNKYLDWKVNRKIKKKLKKTKKTDPYIYK